MIYVDINIEYSATSGNGGKSTPYNIVQFTNHITSALAANDTYGIRGNYSNLGAGTVNFNFYSSASNITVQSWDNKKYGYWKIEADTVSITLGNPGTSPTMPPNIIFKDFVFSNFALNRSNKESSIPVHFKNGIFRSTSDFEANSSANSMDYFEGCTFAGAVDLNDTYFASTTQGEFQFDDCVFYDSPLSDDIVKTLIFNYCVFSGTSATNLDNTTTSARTINNCTFSWIPSATLPTFSEIT